MNAMRAQAETDCVISWRRTGEGAISLIPCVQSPSPLNRGLSVTICTYRRAQSLRRFLDSLRLQLRLPDELLIVDASPDDATECMLREYADPVSLAGSVWYTRVTGRLAGLTRQRNFAAMCATKDLIAFFDDDVELTEECLKEMERVHLALGADVAGVGAAIVNQNRIPSMRWKLRKRLRVIPSLEPGRYYRSGVSTPWGFHPPTDAVMEGDWLNGGAMMWKTDVVRQVQFNPFFQGYSNGEDLDFSLRARRMGRLVLAGKARLYHLPDPGGRPNVELSTYMGHRNAYHIHRTSLPRRTRLDALRFFYAIAVDFTVKCVILLQPGQHAEKWNSLKGTFRFLRDVPRIQRAGLKG